MVSPGNITTRTPKTLKNMSILNYYTEKYNSNCCLLYALNQIHYVLPYVFCNDSSKPKMYVAKCNQGEKETNYKFCYRCIR